MDEHLYDILITPDETTIFYKKGTLQYHIDYNKMGVIHRENGPAIIYKNGHKEWVINGKSHRLDGPAIEFANGEKHWIVNGERHRTDGPAIININNECIWYIKGKILSVDKQKKLTNWYNNKNLANLKCWQW